MAFTGVALDTRIGALRAEEPRPLHLPPPWEAEVLLPEDFVNGETLADIAFMSRWRPRVLDELGMSRNQAQE